MGLDLRSGLRAGFAASALTVGLAACGVLHDPFHPNFLGGEDAAKRVDVYVGGMIAASHPSVVVGRARCPYLIDISGNHTGRCFLPVTGGELPVDVSASGGPTGTTSADTLIVRSEAEPRVAAELGFPTRAIVHCPGPAVRIVPNYTTIRCGFARPGFKRGTVRVGFNGYDGVYVLGAAKPDAKRDARIDALLDRAVLAQTAARIVLDGPKLGPYLRARTGGTEHDELERRRLIGTARCPSRVTLTPNVHAACTVRVGSASLPYDLRFDRGRGLVVVQNLTVEIVAHVRERAVRYFAYVIPIIDPSLPARSRIRIDCGRVTVALLIPGEGLPCTAYAAGQAFAFNAQLVDVDGSVAIVGRYPED